MSILVGVTGAQSVGKSTFANGLARHLRSVQDRPVTLLEGLGERVRSLGIVVGSASSTDSIAAVYSAHLEREHALSEGGIVIMDRCSVDALAYVRVLNVNSEIEKSLYENVTRLMARNISLVIHLEMSPAFVTSTAAHETPHHRNAIALIIPKIIEEMGLSCISIDAAHCDAIQTAASKVLEIAGVSDEQDAPERIATEIIQRPCPSERQS